MRRVFAHRVLLALLLGAPLAWAQGGDVAPVDTRELPLALLNGAPYLELQLGRARGLFLFDTGANGSAVDRGWVEREQIPYQRDGMVSVMGTTGAMQVAKGRFDPLQLAGGRFPKPVFNLQDFSKFNHPEEGPQVGLLGTDFINCFRTTLDYGKRTVRLEQEDERCELDPARWQPLGLTYVRGIPTVTVRIGGLDLPCKLDSGAAYTTPGVLLDVNLATVRALRAAGRELEESGSLYVMGASGPETLTLLKGDVELQLGPLTLDDVTLVVHPSGTLATRSPVTLASASVMSQLGALAIDPFDHLLWVRRPEGTLWQRRRRGRRR